MDCLRWLNIVFTRVLANAIQRADKDNKNKHGNTAIIFLTQASVN